MKTIVTLAVFFFWLTAISFTTTFAQPYSCDANTLALYHFDEAGGNSVFGTCDPSTNNGVASGTSIVPGQFGDARKFNGIDDFISIGSLSSSATQITIEAWIKLDSYSGSSHEDGSYIYKRRGHVADHELSVRWDGKLIFALGDGTGVPAIASTDIVPLDTWTHIAGTYDGSAMTLYMNGNLIKSVNVSFTLAWSPLVATNVGRDPDGQLDRYFHGTIDELRISSIARTFGNGTRVAIDIKPQSCPNPLNTKSKGRLPVAILGTSDFDVNDVDVSTVELEGVSPLRSSIEDVSTPLVNGGECDCTTDGADGFDDFVLKFDTQAIVAAIGSVEDGDEVVLTITGALLDGTPIEGSDCVIIKSKGKGPNILLTGNGESNLEITAVPSKYELGQNYPNPFNPTTTIQYDLPVAGFVTLKVFDVLGQEVAVLVQEYLKAGRYNVTFNAEGLPSGLYLYRIQAGDFVATKKLLLLK